jgi:hypothetical protein
MKKKEIKKFVDEIGFPLYAELTKIDNQQWKGHDKPFLPLSKNEFCDTRENMERDKLLRKMDEEAN